MVGDTLLLHVEYGFFGRVYSFILLCIVCWGMVHVYYVLFLVYVGVYFYLFIYVCDTNLFTSFTFGIPAWLSRSFICEAFFYFLFIYLYPRVVVCIGFFCIYVHGENIGFLRLLRCGVLSMSI